MYRVCLSPPYISLWKHPAMLRDMAGREGNALICFLCCGYFLTPPSLVTPPLYFAMQNTGEEVNTLRCIVFVFLPLYFLTETPRSATGHGREEVNTLRCIVFVFHPPPIFPYGNTPQCYGTRQGRRGISSYVNSVGQPCFSV